MWQRITDAMKQRAALGSGRQAVPPLSSWVSDADTSLPTSVHDDKVSATTDQDSSSWEQAAAQYSAQIAAYRAQPLAALFKSYGSIHLCVAEILWDQRESLKSQSGSRVVHVSSPAGLVAVYSPHQRIVQLRASPTALSQIAHAQTLSLRVMPESARLLEGQAQQGFSATSLAALLWHWGQSEARALQAIPSLGKYLLSMRRFPSMPPSGMLERHFRLIHILSQSRLRFVSAVNRLVRFNSK